MANPDQPNSSKRIRRLPRIEILRPLAIRDFALFWTGMSVSMLGDGIYWVAIAWEAYQLRNSPSSLALLGFAWMAPQVIFLLVGGVLADRYERRLLLIIADLLRALAVTALAVMTLTNTLELWEAVIFVAIYGVGEAMFGPAFGAIVPELVPKKLLVQANSLDQIVRALGQRMIGPAIGGVLVGNIGAGPAFAVDASTFVVSILALGAIRKRIKPAPAGHSAIAELRVAMSFVSRQTWLWVTLAVSAIFLLLIYGPIEVLLPDLVLNKYHQGGGSYGAVIAAGGIGAAIVAMVMAQRGLPRKHILVMYLTFGAGGAILTLFAFATTSWHAMIIYLISDALFAVGMIIWATLMHEYVPSHLLGRISSLDWFTSASLIPVSFILTAPVAQAVGANTTIVGAAVIATLITFLCLLIPGLRRIERLPRPTKEDVAATTPVLPP